MHIRILFDQGFGKSGLGDEMNSLEVARLGKKVLKVLQ